MYNRMIKFSTRSIIITSSTYRGRNQEIYVFPKILVYWYISFIYIMVDIIRRASLLDRILKYKEILNNANYRLSF